VQYLKKVSGKTGDEAVSPVVGVMLMLVVVIIIAAVVSGFSGGMLGATTQKAPTLNMDVKVINTGSWAGSGFFATVTGVSKPIPTEDIRIVTSWTAANGGVPKFGGNTTVPKEGDVHYLNGILYNGIIRGGDVEFALGGWAAPWGGGPGVSGSTTAGYSDTNPSAFDRLDQQFGYYKLVPGTTLTAKPWGQATGQNIGGSAGSSFSDGGYGISAPYTYTLTGSMTSPVSDAPTALLGANWEILREGDKVNIKVIHIPTGKVIFNKDVPVTEG